MVPSAYDLAPSRRRGSVCTSAFKAGEAIRIICERLWQHLQRHVSVELGVPRSIHLAHPAFADLGGDAVAPDALESHLIRPETGALFAPPVAPV